MAKPGAVDGATAKALVAAGAKVVDVRRPQEFASGHVPGAINIPYEEIGKRAAEIGPASTPVVLYCRRGRRSGIAAEALQKAGYKKVYDLKTGDRLARRAREVTGAALAALASPPPRPRPRRQGTARADDGVPIAYDVRGQGKVAVVLVHCWACDRSFWKEQVDPLARRYRVVTLDLGGHGASGADRAR